ncbi:DUF3267 domain-containing protein [Globicatella sanguinis]
MKIWKEINLVDDQNTLKKLSRYSLVILIASVIILQVILGIMQAFYQFSKAPLSMDIKRIFIELTSFVALFMIVLIIHEAIHGVFFKQFNPTASVKFGYQTGMVYASSPGSRYTRTQFIVIALMPCLIITLTLIALFPIVVPHLALFDILTATHLSVVSNILCNLHIKIVI